MVMFINVPSENKVKSFKWTHLINGLNRDKTKNVFFCCCCFFTVQRRFRAAVMKFDRS